MQRLLLAVILCSTAIAHGENSKSIADLAGVQGGLVVHLGCGDGRLTAALRANDHFIVHGLDANAQNVAAARQHIQSLGLYGRVSVEHWDGQRLPYVDNFVNLLVVSGECRVTNDEMLRVLAPNGVALVGGKTTVKPWPKDIDEWTHYLHGPDNNAVANDTVIGPPAHYQWIGSPDYLRHHDHLSGLSAMVSANGRLFYIMDLGPRWSVLMPPKWTLVARDAFNGTILWQRPIENWHPHLWALKHGPAQIMRRLVAVGDTVYVTPGYGEPVSALDAATGRTLRTFADTKGAEEFIVADGTLYALVNPEGDVYRAIPKDSAESIRAATRTWNWDEKPRRVVAVETAGGRTLWSKPSVVAPGTLATAGGRVYLHDGDRVVCLDARDGRDVWVSKPVPRWKPMHVLFSPTLVVHQDVVLFAGGEKLDPQRGGNDTMTAFSARTGETLWTAPHPPSGYASAEDLFVINGLVWCGVTSSPRDSGVFTGRDLRTGEVKAEFPPDDWRHMPHHRCHRAKATCNFILTSRTGIEFVDLAAKHWTANHWVRGSCNYGILPANGLVYAGPHSCACYLLAKLNGMNALAARRSAPREVVDTKRLQRGPAFAEIRNPKPEIRNSEDWPTYRGNAARGGVSKTKVPVELKRTWQTPLGGKLSAPTVADGKLFVAAIDAHIVHALDAHTGGKLWSFTAGGRVDSPTTIWQGRVLFGSADGHIYCLRAEDGALAWKFRAAPMDQRLMAREQVESVWPVSGAVLVREGVVYGVAGRSMWLDGGLRLVRLDAASGQLLSETVMDDKFPGTQDNLQKDLKWPNLPVALPDILSCDGKFIYMRSQPFDLEGNRTAVITPQKHNEQRGETAHLFSPTGFLDDSYWHRTHWLYGRSFISGAGGWYLAGYQAPAGRLLAVGDDSICGFGEAPLRFVGTPKAYHLFACRREPKLIDTGKPAHSRGGKFWGGITVTTLDYNWSQSAPLIARGMVLADQTLFVAGPPSLVDEAEASAAYGDAAMQARMTEHVAAFEGKRGALLMAVSKKEGKTLAAYRLDSPPVFDGLIAANGRLFVATMDGKVMCLSAGEGNPLPLATDAKLSPLTQPARAAAPAIAKRGAEAPTISHPDFQHLVSVSIAPSDLGYRMTSARGETALALKKLPAPLTKHATFRAKVRASPGGAPDRPGNGFIVFGGAPEDAALVKCGFRVSGKCLSVVQGPLAKGKGTSKKAEIKSNEVMEMVAEVDLVSQKLKLTLKGETSELTLNPKIEAITWVGLALTSVTTDFGPLEVSGE